MFAGRFSSSVGPIGIDLGTRGIKLIQVREHAGRLDLVAAAAAELNAGDDFPAQLRSLVVSGGFSGRRCVFSLPRNEVSIQSVRLPRMPDHELRQAVGWEAAQRFGFDREAMEVDFIRTGAALQSGEGREEILLLAAPHAALLPRLEAVMSAGLRPIAVDTDFGALARFYSRKCRRESDQGQVRVVVEIGHTGSTIMILRGDQIAFCKQITVGGDHFTQAVMEHLQLDRNAAAELRLACIHAAEGKERTGPSTDPSTTRAVFEAVRPFMGDLIKEIVLCLRYYGVTFRGHPPERIILAGGEGLEPQLASLISQACKLPVAIDDADGTLAGLRDRIATKLHRTEIPAPGWATATGLSMRGLLPIQKAKPEEGESPARRGAAAKQISESRNQQPQSVTARG